MRKLFFLWLLLPLIGIGQNKNVMNTFRVFPKVDKVMEFEKALAAHAQKFHTGDWKWRVFTIESGPDAGGYHVTEGPNTWDALDGRGEISAEHQTDWNKNVAPLLTDRGSQGYSSYDADLSTVQLTDFADKIIITHIFPKPGKVNVLMDLIKKSKKAWELGKESVAVYESESSGPPSVAIVYRLKGGLKEMNDDFRKPMKERYEAVNGEGSWQWYLSSFADAVESRWSEMLFLKPSLGSK